MGFDVIGLLGLVLTIAGLAITIWNSIRARSAAEQAALAAHEARNHLLRWQGTVDFATIISRIDALKGEHRRRNWQGALERYSDLRRDLIAVQANLSTISEEQRSRFQACIVLLARLEEEVEAHLMDQEHQMDVAKINAHISRSLDGLQRVLQELRRSAGGSGGES